ncbi:unnamed protein product, partial [Strongylus vulgaris]
MRDITRKTQEKEKRTVGKGSGGTTEQTLVHPLFDIQDETIRGRAAGSKKVQEKDAIDVPVKPPTVADK